uniref:DUF659 domain-containing protein n=1 Tax=Megaselia scalaris TaxID=36166 RepID=T1GZ66_MEGSC
MPQHNTGMGNACNLRLIQEKFESMTNETKALIKDNRFHGTTADIWSSRGRSFLGVTIHCIDSETLKRKSRALAVKKLSGRHTAYNIGIELQRIFYDFQLHKNKNVVTVTDNGSNFSRQI